MAAFRFAVAVPFVFLLLASVSTLTSASTATVAARTDVTPLQKVLQLLEGMAAKGKQEKHEEEVEFAKFQEWCDGTREGTTKSINEAASQIEQLTADIAKAEADAEELAGEIADLEKSIAQAEGELEKATQVRDKEHGDYVATHADFSESVDAIERAISVLKSREADVPQSLIQVRDAPGIPQEAKIAIESFLAQGAGEASQVAPEANAYEFQSGGVVGMLEKLRHKFQDQRLALEKEEMNAKANFEMLAQKLTDNIKEDKKRAADKTATKAQRVEDAAIAKGDLKATEATKAEDEKKLADTLAACHAKSEEYEKNQVVRHGEIEAIAKAMEILRSDDVSGAADKHLPALVQLTHASMRKALVQLRGKESPEESMCRERLTSFLQGRARDLNSRFLSLAAEHASADPFGKVKKMIKDLIVKLMEQANSEADHKAYCDTELATNKQTRNDKQAEVEELAANIEKHESESAQLAQQVSELSDAVAELRREQAEATALRKTEKATNEQTIAEAKAAQAAVERATKVLKDFYGKASEASFVQGGAGLEQEMQAASHAPYKGMQSESGGIVGFLEVILSDFARLETETSSAEDDAASSYQKFMDESNEDIAVKETEMDHKEHKKQDTDAETLTLKKQLQLTQEELDAALAYYDKLKPDCVDNNLSYEDRVHMREEEIQSLKEALDILNQQDLA
eukprot:CAMPEP_0115428626 /NCGR_PEP_ID=MMETSP0271-20121206/30082_1 /TAXON_ID=71861 /ORGANISM="Scrippsiella trochoidea, Strain CCMP3099" /LENGTH=687 /DNA_ID=CAMNT_0002853741 /DNA_START=78 /DNA_END=2141 /DNA_ORIENTATION=+